MEGDFGNYGEIVSPSDFCDCCSDSCKGSILKSSTDDCSFLIGETKKDEYDSWKFGWDDESNMFCILSQKTSKRLSISNSFSIGCSRKGVCGVWCRKDCELSKFYICCRDSSILFSKSDFSSVCGTGKGVYESKSGNEYYENCGQCGWKFDSEEVNPH